MAIPLGEECRVSLTPPVLGSIAQLSKTQAEHVQTELCQIVRAGHTPKSLEYKSYGDLSVFRCGDEMRLFGVVLEYVEFMDSFDHLVIIFEVSVHDYDKAGVSRKQAQGLIERFSDIETKQEFYKQLRGDVFDESDILELC